MENLNLIPVTGIIQRIERMGDQCCQQMVTIQNQDGVTNLIVSPDTYVIDTVRMRIGMRVTAFYDGNLPVPLIYPPQFQSVMIGRSNLNETIYVGYFDEELLAADGSLRLNISRATEVVTSNGQKFDCPVGDQVLVVYYSVTTRSIPPQATPRKIIVMC